MKPLFNKGSAFNTITNQDEADQVSYLATKKAEDIIQNSQHLQIKQVKSQSEQPSPLISLLLGIFIALIKDSSKEQISEKISSSIFSNLLSNHIKVPLLRLIATIIEKKLYKREGVDNQISYSVIFKNFLLSFFVSIVSENSSLIGMQKVVNLHKTLLTDNYMLYIPIYLYYLYGGSLFTIQKKIFKNQFKKLITNLSYVLSKQETILTRSFDRINNNKFQNQILSQSLNIVCSATNKQYLEEITQKLSALIFREKDYIKKQQFCLAISNLPDQDQSKEFIFFYLNLLRVQFQISLQHNNSTNHFETSEKGNTSFYANEMQKILKKCPYNGDSKCDCKKCQCVRRNRQSAKLSQQKKRNAVEQLEPMKQKIFFLETRNKQLEEQNMILKGLLNSLKNNPELKSILMNTIEPVSKILQDH